MVVVGFVIVVKSRPALLTVKNPLIVAVLLAASGALACNRAAPAPEPAAQRNVVLITIDTLRADRVGRGIAPTLDGLARSGVSFINARTTVPLTLPAHVSLMTGTPPPIHSVRENGIPFSGGLPTLAKIFRGAGYRTAAFVGAYVLDRRFGLADGFETYDDRVKRDPDAAARLEAERRAGEVVDAAGAWLDRHSAEEILGLMQLLNRQYGKTVIMVTHDARAAEYATHRLHVDKGQLLDGQPAAAA